MHEDLEMAKKELRRHFGRLRRRLLDGDEGMERSLASQRVLLQSDLWRRARRVALYAALPGEVGTDLLLDEAWRCKKDVFLPRCRPEKPGEMDLLACASRSELCVSSMGIAEPRFLPCSRFWEREGGWDDALVVVPGLAFDRMGYRLGYGGGYYDRFLEDARSVSVGLTLLGLIANQALPRGSWDRAVMHLCSEEGLICCKG